MAQINNGIEVSGSGAIHATTVVGGANVQASFTTIVGSEKQQLLDEIMQKLDQLAGSIQREQSVPDRQLVADSALSLKTELAKEKPNKFTISSVLEGIVSSVKSVTSIATAVEALKVIITKVV